MANSLQDQLVKAGLATEKQVKESQTKSRKQAKQAGKKKKSANRAPRTNAASHQIPQAQAQKAARDRALNREHEERRARKALRAQVRDLIESRKLNDPAGEVAHNFVKAGKIKRVYVTDEQHKLLSEGRLAVVAFEGKHYLVEPAVADTILQKLPQSFVYLGKEQDTSDEDDAYADYKIPDDLMW